MSRCWYCNEHQLSYQELKLYSFIKSNGGQVKPSDVSEFMDISKTATSNLLRKLELKNLLERFGAPRYRTYKLTIGVK